MKIDQSHMQSALRLYNIDDLISSCHYFIDGYAERNGLLEVKVIVKVEFDLHESVVIKFLKEKNHLHDVIEQQSIFSEHLRKNGILTPKRYRADNKYCSCLNINGVSIDITVEECFGENIKFIDFDLAYSVGALIARIHNISERDNCCIGVDTIFNVVGYSEVSGFNKFIELGDQEMINKSLFDEIVAIYNIRLNRIRSVWNTLPRAATQGDISINNLTVIDNELGIFDYNIAGDEILIGDMILEGLLTAYEMDLATKFKDVDKHELFTKYLSGYLSERCLTDAEKSIFGDIYAISDAMWFTKIIYSENSLSKLIERSEIDKANELLVIIKEIISGDYNTFFNNEVAKLFEEIIL